MEDIGGGSFLPENSECGKSNGAPVSDPVDLLSGFAFWINFGPIPFINLTIPM
jgi:hypothetical protein